MKKNAEAEPLKRNDVLRSAIFARWRSVSVFCHEKKFNEVEIGKLINLKRSPLTCNGDFLLICKWLSFVLHMDCEDLFPLHLYGIKLKNNNSEIAMSSLPPEEMYLLGLSGGSLFEGMPLVEIRILFGELFDLLLPREAEIIMSFYGLGGEKCSMNELARRYGVTHTRVYQVRERALRKLKKFILEKEESEGVA